MSTDQQSSVPQPAENKLFEPPPETITITEVAFMYQVIQACAQRGAFKPDEFKDVGVLNEKLKSLLDYAKKLEEDVKAKEKGVAEDGDKKSE